MNITLLSTAFPALRHDVAIAEAQWRQNGGLPPRLDGLPDDVAQDVATAYVRFLSNDNRFEQAANYADRLVYADRAHELPPLHVAWLWLVKMAVFAQRQDWTLALGCAENALEPIADIPGKKNDDCLALLAALLLALAYVHHNTGDDNRATKELTKAQKLLERLAHKNEARFSALLLYAVQASTEIITSRTRQMNILAHYQSEGALYEKQLQADSDRNQARQAMTMLVDSLDKQGQIMLRIGDNRNAVRYYTKALRYRKKLGDPMDLRDLSLSIGLARALLRLQTRRNAAEQLLNSLQPLAKRLNAHNEAIEIENLLATRPRNASIMTMLKGIF